MDEKTILSEIVKDIKNRKFESKGHEVYDDPKEAVRMEIDNRLTE